MSAGDLQCSYLRLYSFSSGVIAVSVDAPKSMDLRYTQLFWTIKGERARFGTSALKRADADFAVFVLIFIIILIWGEARSLGFVLKA